MGDIKRTRKKYATPGHPWNRERIDMERGQMRQYGLTNKKELWKTVSTLKFIKDQIKQFPSMPAERAAEQREKLSARLVRMGLIEPHTPLGEVLGFDSERLFDRRLQTMVFKRGLARTVKQARQLITHEHIVVGGRTINAPGYLVLRDEESTITFHPSSPLMHEMHPERIPPAPAPKPKKEKRQDAAEDVEVVALEENTDVE